MRIDDGGGGSGFTDSSYDDFEAKVQGYLDDLHASIQKGIDEVRADWDNSHLSGVVKFISPAAYAASEYAAHKLEDAFNALWDAFDDMAPKVWDQMRRLFATPGALMQISQAYSDASGKLKPEAITIDRVARYVADGWAGDAFHSYSGAATEQNKALAGVATALTTAATLCSQGANSIYTTWFAVADYVFKQISLVLAAIQDGTDAGQWVTLDAGPAIKVIGSVAVSTLQLAEDLAKVWAQNTTTGVAAWNNLNSGSLGLAAENQWPDISGYDKSTMGDKGEWSHA